MHLARHGLGRSLCLPLHASVARSRATAGSVNSKGKGGSSGGSGSSSGATGFGKAKSKKKGASSSVGHSRSSSSGPGVRGRPVDQAGDAGKSKRSNSRTSSKTSSNGKHSTSKGIADSSGSSSSNNNNSTSAGKRSAGRSASEPPNSTSSTSGTASNISNGRRGASSSSSPSRGVGAAGPGAKTARAQRQQDEVQRAARRASSKATRAEQLKLSGGPDAKHLASLEPYVKVVLESNGLHSAAHAAQEQGPGGGRGRGARKSKAYELLKAYKSSFLSALDCELYEEWVQAEARLASWTASKLQAGGYALLGLNASPDGALFKDSIFRLYGPGGGGGRGGGGAALPQHNLAQGDIVLLSRGKPGDDALEGVVVDYSSRWVRVAVPSSAAAPLRDSPGPWRLDQYANTTAHERCVAAVSSFASEPASADEAYGYVRRLLLGDAMGQDSVQGASELPPPWMRGPNGHEVRQRVTKQLNSDHAGVLNDSQLSAVEAALCRSLTLWQGPPGTGKTRTLAAYIQTVAKSVLRGRGAVLASAASNVAVDNLLLALGGSGLRVVRVGQPVRVLPELREITLEAQVAAHPKGRVAALTREQACKVQGERARELWDKAQEMEKEAVADILGAADVVAATCIGSGDPRLEGHTFPVVVLDEATQATEPVSLVPLMRRAQSVVLVGDQRQLPPTVMSRQAVDLGMGISVFERLQLQGVHPLLLALQYRMHPGLAHFPSGAFYGRRLRSAPKPHERPAPLGFVWPSPKVPVVFVDVSSGRESRTAAISDDGSTTSFLNEREARCVVEVVGRLLAGADLRDASSIGVITPYNGQVKAIRGALHTAASGGALGSGAPQGSGKRGGSASSSSSSSSFPRGEKGMAAAEALEVKSVDGFQGREKEVIVFSAVRSNDSGSIGFLADARRMNVALTRAKRGLVVVGSRRTLQGNPLWARWLLWAEAQGAVVGEQHSGLLPPPPVAAAGSVGPSQFTPQQQAAAAAQQAAAVA